MLCQTFHGAEQVEVQMHCPICWTVLYLEYSGGDTLFKRLLWQHFGCPEKCVSVLGGVQCFGWTRPCVTAGHVQVSKQGVLVMSQIYIASLLLELTETIQTAFTVTRCNLDLEIQHFVPLEIPIMGQFSPSEALYLHLLPVVLQVVVSVSEPFGSQMPLFAPNRNAMFPVLIRTLKLYPKRYQSTFLLSAPFFFP